MNASLAASVNDLPLMLAGSLRFWGVVAVAVLGLIAAYAAGRPTRQLTCACPDADVHAIRCESNGSTCSECAKYNGHFSWCSQAKASAR